MRTLRLLSEIVSICCLGVSVILLVGLAVVAASGEIPRVLIVGWWLLGFLIASVLIIMPSVFAFWIELFIEDWRDSPPRVPRS